MKTDLYIKDLFGRSIEGTLGFTSINQLKRWMTALRSLTSNVYNYHRKTQQDTLILPRADTCRWEYQKKKVFHLQVFHLVQCHDWGKTAKNVNSNFLIWCFQVTKMFVRSGRSAHLTAGTFRSTCIISPGPRFIFGTKRRKEKLLTREREREKTDGGGYDAATHLEN